MPTLCVSSPYIAKHLGGGEKYLLDVAVQATQLGWDVSVAVPVYMSTAEIDDLRERLDHFYGSGLHALKFISLPVFTEGSIVQKWLATRKFDAFFWITDGSVFISGSRRNILHFQIPLTQPPSTFTQLKLLNWPVKTANSDFTRQHIESAWHTNITLTHPPLVRLISEQTAIPKMKKQKHILSVGRFFRQLHSKRQDILIDAFKELTDQRQEKLTGWKLILVGNVEDEEYFQELKKAAKGLAVEFKLNLSRKQLDAEYEAASLYWHAAGFEVDAGQHPEKVEHFGISTAEAMSAGCIPLVVPAGGQPKVVGATFQQFCWTTIPQLVENTAFVIDHPLEHAQWRQAAYTQASTFGERAFRQKLAQALGTSI